MSDYKWIGFNRPIKHKNSPYNFGGVGIFIKNYLYSSFNVSIENKLYDGILEIFLKEKITGYTIVIFCCYLPPERSPWGRNCTQYFSHIMSQLYLCSDADIVVLCGDLNARIGGMKDYTQNIDLIEERIVIDQNVNNHGKTFIEFLNDSKMCVLNGRGESKHDNFTYVSPQGKSVVDYFFVPHDVLKYCTNFKVQTMNDIIEKHNLQNLLHDKCKKPDHSLISLDISISSARNISNDINNEKGQNKESHVKSCHLKRYNLKRMPNNMFMSEICKQALLNVINTIECNRESQSEIDTCYVNLTDIIVKEMSDKIPIFNTRKDKKKFKVNKPYWNDELSSLWKDMHVKEKEFLQQRGSNKKRIELRLRYKVALQKLDRNLRKYKRQYERGKVLEIESVCTNNPREFWSYIKNLGPRTKKNYSNGGLQPVWLYR